MKRVYDALIEHITTHRIKALFWMAVGGAIGYLAAAAGVDVLGIL